MQSENLLNINLAHADEAAKRLDIELTDSFFANLEQEEISGGDLHAVIHLKASAPDIFTIQIHVEGKVTVACDRCLEPLSIPVDASDTIKVKDAAPDESDDPELRYLEARQSSYDLSWDVYEIVETALPMQRVHPEGECNEDMVSYIIREDEADNVDDEDLI